jgi:galactokinase
LFRRCLRAWRGWSALAVERACFVPGRVELLGKHTDYAGGRSLLCALDRGFCAVAAPRPDSRVRLLGVAGGEAAEFTVGESCSIAWATYAVAVARRFRPGGADIAFLSDLPPAAGMSSSSAMVVMCYLALTGDALQGSREVLAAELAAAEVGVGTHGGSEDHTAILCCRQDRWSQFRFCPLRPEAVVPAPCGMRLVVGVSGVIAAKTGAARAAYNQVSAVAGEIVARWNAATGRHDPHLASALAAGRDARPRLEALLQSAPHLAARLAQFCNETEVWIPAAVAAVARADWSALGAAVDASQAAADLALGNQTPETRFLAASARSLGAIAASSFGAGFGGSVWALVRAGDAAAFRSAWQAAYHQRFAQHRAASLFLESAAGASACVLPQEALRELQCEGLESA